MENELFVKLLEHEGIKDVPLLYIIKIFSAIQEILESEKVKDSLMDRG